jgi:hypothetical protein
MDDLYKLLSEFERKLEQLRKQGELATQAPQLFREFSAEVERRTGGDRRQAARSTRDRRGKN